MQAGLIIGWWGYPFRPIYLHIMLLWNNFFDVISRLHKLIIALVIVAIAAMLYPALGQKGKKLVVTVYPFKAAGASEATAEALTSITTYELGKSDKIKIIREGNLKKVLDKQGLSMSGACDDSECQVEIGKLLNSQKFVRGDLAKIGKKFIITMEVVNIQSGENEFTTRVERICPEEELTSLISSPIGAIRCYLETNDKKKCALEKDEPSELPPPPSDLPPDQPKIDEPQVGARHAVPKGVGSLYVTTTPKGADVYVDAELKGKTPVEVKNLSAGDHDLMVTMQGHAPLTKTVSVSANKRTDIVERLSAQKGKLSIKSNPPGAAAYLDGKYIGKTPVELPGVLIGDHSVKFELKDYGSEERSVKVEVGGDAEVAVNLQGMPGKLLIATVPEGAQVFIDGKEVGTTTYSGEIPAGKHKIRVSKSGYKSKEEDVDIAPNRAKQLSWTLEKGPDAGEMVLVPAGDFMMGCNSAVDNECSISEKPYHKVYLDAFYIDKYEVTVDNYKTCVNAGKCKTPNTGGNCNWNVSGRGNHPINCVDWNQSVVYCEYAGKRLPTEAEWEKAARGTDGRKYPWGNNWSDRLANFYDSGKKDGYDGTSPVGSFSDGASPYGAMDMAGNVWEWTSDWYNEKYYNNSPDRNPKGTSSGNSRVLRGGSYVNDPSYLRSSRHGREAPVDWTNYLGFRCAKDI